MLIFPLNVFPWVINGLIEAWVSLNRVNRFLILEELDWQEFYSSITGDGETDSSTMVVVENGHFTWNTSNEEDCVENDDTSHSNDLIKREKAFEENVEIEDGTKSGHTQPLQNINLSICKVQYVIHMS